MRNIVVVIFFFLYLPSLAQNRLQEFEFVLPEKKVNTSDYDELEFLDSRRDTTSLGIIQTGAFNKLVWVMPVGSMKNQLRLLFGAIVGPGASERKMLFQLREFRFAEITSPMSETGYCYLRYHLYGQCDDGNFTQLAFIDTVIEVSSMDVTKKLYKTTSEVIATTISGNLNWRDGREHVSYTEIVNVEKNEMSRIPAFSGNPLKDGIYTEFAAFASQVSDTEGMIEDTGRGPKPKLKIKNKFRTIMNGTIFGIVHHGEFFISTESGLVKTQKKEDGFYFIGKSDFFQNSGPSLTVGVFFGLVGTIITSEMGSSFVEMKIDHLNGDLIPLRVISR